ncbi:MAG: hypothetical protein IJP45_04320 [Paludibacteraceae bacterium]|nr:hypothetical protein [Paludibacteraceae bacterium]
MKKIILMVAAAVMMTSCGFTKSSTTSTPAQTTAQTTAPANALTAGQGAGTALQALRSQYVLDGNKFDYKNMQNILNTVQLLANCEGLKENYKNKEYLTEFGKGMIASSLGLVSQNNVQTVTNSLVNMVTSSQAAQNAQSKLQETATQTAQTVSSAASSAAGYANTAAQYAGALSSLLGAFSGK